MALNMLSSLAILGILVFFAAGVVALVVIVSRRFATQKELVSLSLIALVLALGYVPAMRLLPEHISIWFFLVGILPVIGFMVLALVTNALNFSRTQSKIALAGMLLSILAIALFYINAMTPFFWPYPRL